MLRWLSVVTLLALALTLTGCGAGNSEIPAKKDAAPAPQISSKDSAQKAQQMMTQEMKDKMKVRTPK